MLLGGFPVGFWLSLVVLLGAMAHAWSRRREPWGIPAMAICGTVLAWYHCDALYNDYQVYTARLPGEAVDAAWWQVAGFLVCFIAIAPALYRQFNRATAKRPSRVFAWIEGTASTVATRRLARPLLGLAAGAWLVVIAVALVRTDFDWQGMFLPWLDHLAQPWGRNRIGTQFDFALSFFSYLNIFCLTCFGIAAALSEKVELRLSALLLMAISWPAVFLDRTRNTMLALLVPGLLCLVFIRMRGRVAAQVATLATAFLAVSVWFSFVVAHRSNETIVQALATSRVDETMEAKHEGLNMFEELCWINALLRDGSYRPNWGERYFADLVNIVPRALWPGKPLIGFDYAIARGYGTEQTSDGIHASIATGMIGQGVVNFGPWGGPLAAAVLASVWVAGLALLDLNADRMGRLPLYLLGLALTFNLGRDITLLTVYPLLFGYVLVLILERKVTRRPRRSAISSKPGGGPPPSPANAGGATQGTVS
jgi:hypothetical protein